MLYLVVGVDGSFVDASQKSGSYAGKGLLRVVHVTLAYGQGLDEETRGLLKILERHLAMKATCYYALLRVCCKSCKKKEVFALVIHFFQGLARELLWLPPPPLPF